MNHRHVHLAVRLTAGALAALSTFGALAAEPILYTYQGQALTDYSYSARAGYVSGKTYDPGVAFGFYLEAPLEAGQSVSFEQADGWYSFNGVMGQDGAFQTWDFIIWKAPDYEEHSRYSAGKGSDGSVNYFSGLSTTSKWNSHQPGVWTSTPVTALPSGKAYNTAFAIPWVNPDPEADASVMALLGLAAVVGVARRKAKAQAQEPSLTA